MAYIFLVVGVVPELLYTITGLNTYIIYWVVPGAVLGVLLTGGIQRTLQHRAAWYWIAFFLWLLIGLPMSHWRGGSYANIYDYTRICMTLLFVAGGLATNWKESRAILYTAGAAGVLNVLTARFFGREENGRLNMTATGTIGNSNDLAAHLLFVLPFVLYIAMDRKRNVILRRALWIPMIYGVWVILGTASRGGLIACAAVLGFLLIRATATQRVLGLTFGILAVGGALLLLPATTRVRLGALFGGQDIEAEQSSDAREYLFRTSLRYTAEHPIFGVGFGQFANFEGEESRAKGQTGNWHATHCTWTQVSAECGIPALIFFVLGIGSAFSLVHRTWRKARQLGFTDISNACLCFSLSMVGLLVAITFLANAYRFYIPTMIGLAISMSLAAMRHMSAKAPAQRGFGGTMVPRPLALP